MSTSRIYGSSEEAFLKGAIAAEAAQSLEATPASDFLRLLKLTKTKTKDKQLKWIVSVPPDQKPEQGKHAAKLLPRTRVRERKSYISPAREDTVTIAAHAAPELKEALKKKFEQSGFEHFNDFLVASLQRVVAEPAAELKPTTELAETALHQSRELQKTISRLTQDLSTRPSRSR